MVYDEVVPVIIPRSEKVLHTNDILSKWEFVQSICSSARYQLEHCQGSFTDLMCFDSIMEEHKPLGEPNRQIECG